MKLYQVLNGGCVFAGCIPGKFCFGCSFYEAELQKRVEEDKKYQELEMIGMTDNLKPDDRGW